MKKVVIYNKDIIEKIIPKRGETDKLIIYIMGKDEKLAIIKADSLKRRVFIPIEKITNVIKNI